MTRAPNDSLMTPAEVARLFGVDAKTVTRWAKTGKLDCVRTLGGHRRYRTAEVLALFGVDIPCVTGPQVVDLGDRLHLMEDGEPDAPPLAVAWGPGVGGNWYVREAGHRSEVVTDREAAERRLREIGERNEVIR